MIQMRYCDSLSDPEVNQVNTLDLAEILPSRRHVPLRSLHELCKNNVQHLEEQAP